MSLLVAWKNAIWLPTLKMTAGMLYVWYMAAVRQIGFSKETQLDHSTPCGSPLPTPTKFRENTLIGAEIYPSKIQTNFSGGGILLPVPILTTVILHWPSCVSSSEISRKSVNAQLSYCDSTFSLHEFYLRYRASESAVCHVISKLR